MSRIPPTRNGGWAGDPPRPTSTTGANRRSCGSARSKATPIPKPSVLSHVDGWCLDATDPFTYADAVTDLLDVWGDEDLGNGYHPHGGWPWLWPDSHDTDWVFTFVHGRVWITTGRAWRPARPPVGATTSTKTKGERTRWVRTAN